jgi:hypothetical protein
MMEAARTSETSIDNYFTRQYSPEDNSEVQFKLNKSRDYRVVAGIKEQSHCNPFMS